MSAHRLVTLHFGPNALTGRCACGATIIAPRGTTTIRRALDNHRAKRTTVAERTRAPWSLCPRTSFTRLTLVHQGDRT